ncbi:Lrp/AsnC ligand binding domain-containing protein [Pilimelia columellifera]|uniref:Lrp/AsnC ligand binding domain-containing protein n=1 Tax=Pilimelia columellifera subsp. columellifera TaxID=706583 RepID=A0ABN3N4V3_9ACTN
MVQAYILIHTEIGKTQDVAATISGISGVVRVDVVTGPYDVIVVAEADTLDALGKLVLSEIQRIPSITRTTTCTVVNL